MEYNYGNSFYSFDFGMVHVINLNPYSSSNTTSPQYQWLLADLEAVDRVMTPWVIVMMHCPWYNSNTAHHDEYQTVLMKKYMEELLYKSKVNLIISGHVHAYERSHPVFNGEVVSDGVTNIVIGDAGNAEGHASTYHYPQPSWSAYRNGTQYGESCEHSLPYSEYHDIVFYTVHHVSNVICRLCYEVYKQYSIL